MSRVLYTAFLHLLLPLVLLRLAWRGRRQPEYLRHVGERFGRYRGAEPARVIWIHAVSVGETRAARPLVERLMARYPGHRILFTHMTPTGRETSGELFDGRVSRIYLPYDYPFAVARFLDHFHPAIGLVMETELWPNLFAQCARRGVPLLLLNARLSERSARRYQRIARLARGCLRRLTAIGAQSADDARRLLDLGAPKVEVLGNMKFDVAPSADRSALGAPLRQRIGARPVLLAASTREGEEALLLEAYRSWQGRGWLLVIVPRHPQRFAEVADLAGAAGFRVQRRSDEAPVASQTEVLIGDSMGEMFAYYAAADVALIGGSLLPLGGQNLIEACAVGTPVLVGPHTFNFAEVTELALAAGAARRVADAAAALREAAALLEDADARRQMGEAGLQFAADHRGATDRTMALVERVLAAGAGGIPATTVPNAGTCL